MIHYVTTDVNVLNYKRVCVSLRECVFECIFGPFLSLGCELEWTGLVSVWTDKRKLLILISYHSTPG